MTQEEIKKRLFEISTSNFNSVVDFGAYSAGYIDGAKWADLSMVEKACEWLDENLEKYIFEGREGKPYISVVLLDNFKEALQ